MRRWLGLFFLLPLAVGLPKGTFAKEVPIPAELLQAKPVFIQKGVVYRQKHDPTGEASNIEPFREELGKWGRFRVVSDPKEADLILRVSNRDERRSTLAGSPNVSGSVTLGSVYTVIDVLQPSSGRVLWSVAHSGSRSWNTKTAATGAVKDMRKRIEEQEKLGSNAR
jgi:hypothetical protein